MAGRRMPRKGDELQRTPGTLHAPPRVGNGSDPG